MRTPLGTEAVDLLLTLLELEPPVLCAAAAQMQLRATLALEKAGLLAADGYEAVTSDPDQCDDALVSLPWSDEGGHLGYFSPTSGLVTVPSEQLVRRRVQPDAFLAAISEGFALPCSAKPSALVEGELWELGEARIGKRAQRVPLWFGRRLFDATVQRQVTEAACARPHMRPRVVLTSTRAARLRSCSVPGASIIPLRDVLVSPDSIAISSDILDARLRGTGDTPSAEPLVLSPDGTQLRIHGILIRFRAGTNGALAIGKLVEAYWRRERLPARALTGTGTLRRVFGKQKWEQLEPYLKSRNGLWGFEI